MISLQAALIIIASDPENIQPDGYNGDNEVSLFSASGFADP